MSNRFTQKNVAAFLVEQGASEELATNISNYVVVAVRTTSTGAEIKDQSANADFTKYDANLLAADNSEITLAYTVKKLGAGFYEHGVSVQHGDQTYGLSNLIHSALDIEVDVTKPKAVVAEVKEFTKEVKAEVDEFVEEVKEIFAEEVEAPVVEEVVEEAPVVEEVEAPVVEEVAVEQTLVVADTAPEEIVEETPAAPVEEVAAAAPEAEVKKSKAKKAK